MKNNRLLLFIVACFFGLTLFLATYKLTESPPTWFDEGIITQVALNTLAAGPSAVLAVAPNAYVSGWYVTTSYPATFPVVASFWLFGISLLSARIVMVVFVVGLVACAYLLARKEMSAWLAVTSLALLATFAPLYGNGKNVLGEVPGLLFVVLFLLCVRQIESQKSTWKLFLLAGVLLGLAVVTKPIFLLLLPAAGAVLLFSRELLTVKKVCAAVAGFAAASLVWVWTQFGGTTITEVLGHYANPNGTDTGHSLVSNVVSFVTQIEPLYALGLLALWFASFAVRLYYKRTISKAESIAGMFAMLVYIAYLRTIGFYRYFFVGEVLALVYLPLSLATVFDVLERKVLKKYVTYTVFGILAVLVCFQTYQVFFHSWVADHYQSTRAASLESLGTLPKEKTIFLYNTPEAAMFLPRSMQYYQYIDITKKLQVGKEQIAQLALGVPDFVLVPTEAASTIDLSRYQLLRTIDRYSLWYKK